MAKKERNVEIDIIKGLCIISIVFTHIGKPILWFGFFMVYGFYFVAGYTFHEMPFLEFAKNKIYRIYIPFVVVNVLSVYILRILSNICEKYSEANMNIMENIKNSLMFNITNGFMAPSWFLFPLFLILFIFYILNRYLKNEMIVLAFTAIIFLLTHLFYDRLSVLQWCDCAFVNNVGSGLLIFNIGYLLKNKKHIEKKLFGGKYAIDAFVVCTIVMFYISNKVGLDLRAGYCSNTFYLIVAIWTGLYWCIFVSKFLAKSSIMSKILATVGRYSMSIMLFHILAFSVATLAIHALCKLPYPQYWAVAYSDGIYGIITGIVGIAVPMLVVVIVKEIKQFLGKRQWRGGIFL